MGRGRGKGKKQSFAAAFDDIASSEDDKVPVRRRGRPQKQLKDKMDFGKTAVLEEEDDSDDSEGMQISVLSKSSKNHQAATVTENGMKRKRPSQVVENENSVNVHNNVIIDNSNDNELMNACAGYRPNGSRRKTNNPRRAAEVGCECR